ncbi:MAG: hypothetical protein LBJ67_15770, partial [Planctomycetaceae bacterium]|nr:hypothetical protein [Planctomycetaceae bacterium]
VSLLSFTRKLFGNPPAISDDNPAILNYHSITSDCHPAVLSPTTESSSPVTAHSSPVTARSSPVTELLSRVPAAPWYTPAAPWYTTRALNYNPDALDWTTKSLTYLRIAFHYAIFFASSWLSLL